MATIEQSPEEQYSRYESQIIESNKIINSSGLRLILRSLLQGNQLQRPSTIRSGAEARIEYLQARASEQHAKEDLASLKDQAKNEAEAQGKSIDL